MKFEAYRCFMLPMFLASYRGGEACSSCGLKAMYLRDGRIHDWEPYGKSVSPCFIFMPLQK